MAIKAYATRQEGNQEYKILHSGIGSDYWIPVFETEEGNQKLRAHYAAFSQSLDQGLEFMLVDVEPLVSTRLIDKKKLHRFD